MINREQVGKFLDALEVLKNESASLQIEQDGMIHMTVYPKEWWSGKKWTDEKRHDVLSLLTPLVGRLDKQVSGTDIGYSGKKDNVTIHLNYVDQCKILGYKTVTKTVKKEIERPEPVEYEEVEEEQRIAITDCGIREGKFSESDIEEHV
jgi:hypothetical protein